MDVFRRIILLVLITWPVLVAADANNKVEELFIWKISEELKLNPAEEKQFSENFKNLNQRKLVLNTEIQAQVQNATGLKTEKQHKEFLENYKKNLGKMHRISQDEISSMSKIFGIPRTVQYLQVKQELSSKVKTLLTQPSDVKIKDKKSYPNPKLIIE